MPTRPHRTDPTCARGARHRVRPGPRTTRLAALLFVLLGGATAAAQTCTSSWPDYRQINADGTRTAPWSDPTSDVFHTHNHASMNNARLVGATSHTEYLGSTMMVLWNLFGFELNSIADEMGVNGPSEVFLARGMSALDGFVNLDDPIDAGYDDSGTFCANLYAITDGSHEGEFFLVVKDAKTDQIKHMEIAPTEDVGRARAKQIMKDLEKVMLDPDGCGDMRVGEGC